MKYGHAYSSDIIMGAEAPFSCVTIELHIWENQRCKQSWGLAYMHGRERKSEDSHRASPIHP